MWCRLRRYATFAGVRGGHVVGVAKSCLEVHVPYGRVVKGRV